MARHSRTSSRNNGAFHMLSIRSRLRLCPQLQPNVDMGQGFAVRIYGRTVCLVGEVNENGNINTWRLAAAPTARVLPLLAPFRTLRDVRLESGRRAKADVRQCL